MEVKVLSHKKKEKIKWLCEFAIERDWWIWKTTNELKIYPPESEIEVCYYPFSTPELVISVYTKKSNLEIVTTYKYQEVEREELKEKIVNGLKILASKTLEENRV